jgi:hypothetical protein
MNSADESINKAPLTTEKTLKARKNLIFQLFRFVAINIRMVKMIMKGHH